MGNRVSIEEIIGHRFGTTDAQSLCETPRDIKGSELGHSESEPDVSSG